MEYLPDEILEIICRKAGYKATLQLCKTNGELNDKISALDSLWRYFCIEVIGVVPLHRMHKLKFVRMLCFHYYINQDIMAREPHVCNCL